ncbi:uncharacterized protein LOC142568635 [Dermacentor variabilis]|uniref:uncharacterized protein LOC142568635 n=1 Tax=Dermacentor variabilis TaxID=34621 RepID=UPI003F5C357D
MRVPEQERLTVQDAEEQVRHVFRSVSRPSRSEDDGHTFVLPSLGNLHDSMALVARFRGTGSPISSAAFRKIVDMLFTEMKKITLFPTRTFYSRVTSLLLEKYPQLKDVVGSVADSRKVALRYRFKNQRRVLPCDGRVGENRAKFGSRRKGSEETATVELQRHKVQKMDVAISTIAGEEEQSFEMHTEWLSCESRKGSPDEDQINERMASTYILTVAALRILSFNVKEVNGLSSLFVREEDPSVPATPCIVFSGADVVEADLLHIKVDHEKLFAVKNGEEGLAAVLSAYWLFNIQYDRKLFNTLVIECP